jgi:branched-chain amino acid transport system substrate-binding protein
MVNRLAVCAAMAGLFLAPAPARAERVKLGVLRPASGPAAALGQELTRGIERAQQDLRSRGLEVELIWADDAGDPRAGLAAVRRFAEAGVAGIVGASTSDATSVEARAAQHFGVPLVIAAAAQDEITRLNLSWVFRLSSTTDDYAAALVAMARALGAPKTIAILGEDAAFGDAAARGAYAFAKAGHLKVVFDGRYAVGTTDWRATLAAVKAAQPDLIFLGASLADPVGILRQAREMGLAPQAFLAAAGGLEALDLPISAAWEGVFAAAPDAPGAARAHARLATTVLAEEAVKAAGDRGRLRAALEAGTWDGPDGPFSFPSVKGYTHQSQRTVRVVQVQAGQRVTVWPRKMAAAPPVWPAPGSASARR